MATVSAASGSWTCAVTTSGAGYCWGFGLGGVLGDNAETDSNVPVAVVEP